MDTISREDLRRELDSGSPPIVIEVLDSQEFGKQHLPSAINVPFDAAFETNVRGAVPDLNGRVVVYCANVDCPASADAGRKMEALGYAQVVHYPGGKADWKEGGLPMDVPAPARAAR